MNMNITAVKTCTWYSKNTPKLGGAVLGIINRRSL